MIWWALLVAGFCYIIASIGYWNNEEPRLAMIMLAYAFANFILSSIGGVK